jgi:hypothetical protein
VYSIIILSDILAQHPTDLERQSSDAEHEDGQRKESHSGIERLPPKKCPVHVDFLGRRRDESNMRLSATNRLTLVNHSPDMSLHIAAH